MIKKIWASLKNKPTSSSKGKRKHIPVQLLAVCLVFIVCCVTAAYQLTNSSTVNVTINSPSITNGTNPDGTPFDVFEIISDRVLTAAAEKLSNSVTVEELRSHITIADGLKANTNKSIKDSILSGEQGNTYFPSVYRISYHVITEDTVNNGIGAIISAIINEITGTNKEEILTAVTESYQQYYTETYLEYMPLFEIDWNEIDALDYYNRTEAVKSEAMRILRFLQIRHSTSTSHKTETSGLGYGDLSDALWQIIDNDISAHQAYIVQNGLTRSRSNLLRQFQYMEDICTEEAQRKMEEYQVLDTAVSMYDASTTKVVFIPSLDQNNSFYMNRTKVGLDYLMESADDARLAADEATHNAEAYRYLTTRFKQSQKATKGQYEQADQTYEGIKNNIIALSQEVIELVSLSNGLNSEGIMVGAVYPSNGIVGIAMSFAKRFAVYTMSVYVIVTIPSLLSGMLHFYRKERKKHECK